MREWLTRKRGLIWSLTAIVCFGVLPFLLSSPALAQDNWTSLKSRLMKDGFANNSYIENLFSNPELVFNPRPLIMKAKELHKTRFPQKEQDLVLAELRKSYRAYEIESTIDKACAYLKSNYDILKTIENKYDVPKEVIVAILLVESKLEKNIGTNSAFTTLASLASYSKFSDIEPHLTRNLGEGDREFIDGGLRRRADWAYEELKALIRYARKNGVEPLTIKGSCYGAIGICQFMPSNIPLYGADGDKDGFIDLFNRADASASIANYLSKHGWKTNATRSEQQRTIFRYNHSSPYAEIILSVSERLKEKCAE